MEEGVIRNADEVKAYQAEATRKSDFERTEINKEKTGVRLDGVMGINPVNGKQIPIFISDYVLATYGTGAIMAVPAHDSRDWEFAKKFGLPIVEVVKGKTPSDLDKEPSPTWPRHPGQLRLPGRAVGHRRQGKDGRLAGGKRQGPQEGQLQAAGLGVQPPALLGRAHPDGQVRQVRLAAPA